LKRVTITYIEYKNVIRLDRFGPPRITCGEGGISKGDRFICGSVFYPATPGRNWQLSMGEVRSFLNFLENSVVHEGNVDTWEFGRGALSELRFCGVTVGWRAGHHF
jgi:hypothetical protein